MPKPIQSARVEQFRIPVEPLPPAATAKAKTPQATTLSKAVQVLVDQHGKSKAKGRPLGDAAAIARELSRQGGIEAHAQGPRAKLQPFPPGTTMPSRAQSADPDCFNQGLKTVGTCAGAAVLAGAGVATGPGELGALGFAGYMCGTEVNDYYRCREPKP